MWGAINMYDDRVAAAALITQDRSAAGMGTRRWRFKPSSLTVPFLSPVDTGCIHMGVYKQRGHHGVRSLPTQSSASRGH